jgi:hypothetical protein
VRGQCRERDCGKSKVTVVNKGRKERPTASRANLCPAQLRGLLAAKLGSLDSYSPSPLVLSRPIPQRRFLFLFFCDWSTLSYVPVVPQMSPLPTEPYTAVINVTLNAPNRLKFPSYPPSTLNDPRPKVWNTFFTSPQPLSVPPPVELEQLLLTFPTNALKLPLHPTFFPPTYTK